MADLSKLLEALEPVEDDDKPEDELYKEADKLGPDEKSPKEEKTDEVTKEAEGDDKKEEDKEETDKDQETTGEELSLEEQNRELRQILRQQKRDMDILKSKLDRIEKRSIKATEKVEEKEDDYKKLFGDEDEEGKEKGKVKDIVTKEELSDLELAQNTLGIIAREKGVVLETLLETMEMNPNYSDVKEVCSQANFNDIFGTIGDVAERDGKDGSLAALEAEIAVWKMPNPYKFMYDLIKKHHPKYAKTEEKADAGKPKDIKDVKKTPTSIANIPGKSEAVNKWTAAKIDAMDEMELDTVPKDIYDKYLEGDLD